MLTPQRIRILKLVIHVGALAPFLYTLYQGAMDQLGGDPVKALTHFTGMGTLNLLLLSLCVSPLARYRGITPIIRVRRLIGLYSFFYACTHIATYALFDLQLEWYILGEDIIDRPYITVGFSAWLILFSLACTSTQGMQRRLRQTWQKLHNWVYFAVLLGVLHFLWSVKSDITEPLIYLAITAVLLTLRYPKWRLWLRRWQRFSAPSK